MDLVYQINVPKNTKGLNIEQLSGYKREKKVLLAGHQLKVKDYHYEGDKIFLECDLIPLEKQFEIEESVDDVLLNIPLENQNNQIVDTNLIKEDIKEDIFVGLD